MIIILERCDILKGYENISLEKLNIEHIKIPYKTIAKANAVYFKEKNKIYIIKHKSIPRGIYTEKTFNELLKEEQ